MSSNTSSRSKYAANVQIVQARPRDMSMSTASSRSSAGPSEPVFIRSPAAAGGYIRVTQADSAGRRPVTVVDHRRPNPDRTEPTIKDHRASSTR